MQKIKHLDGIRGLAAVVVVLSHFIVAFYPALYNGDINQTHTANAVELLIAKSPLNLFYNGNFAVCIFFILSGYVLSFKYFSTKDSEVLVSSAVKRYFRLLVPVFVTVFLIFFLIKLSLFFNKEASILSFSEWWLGSFWNFDPTFFQTFKNATYDVFFKHNSQYNTVLWTMTYEMLGSFFVFAFMSLFGKLGKRYLVYIAFIALFLKTYYLAFILGMILSDLNSTGHFSKSIYKNRIFKALLFVVGLYFGSYPIGTNVENSVYSYIKTADIYI